MRYLLAGLDCPNCAAKLERELRKIAGLEQVVINFNTLSIDLPPELVPTAQKVIARIEPGIELREYAGSKSTAPAAGKTEWKQLSLIISSGILLIIGVLFNASLHDTPYAWAEYAVLVPSFLLVGWPVVWRALKNITRGELFDESFLMSVATIGAVIIHQLPEAAAVMLFYAVGEYFQERAVNRSKRSIVALLNIQPDYANLKIDGEIRRMNPETVEVGQIIVIKPGEKAPLDGEVLEGISLLDTSALTGEAVPRRVGPGEKVLAGMINGQGLLTVKVTKPFKDSSVARILSLVEEAGERKAPTEQFITVFSHYYTPVVVIGAALLAIIPPLLIPGATFAEWVYRALILLVISCPCALMVSIPLGYFGGIGSASRRGILVKGANFLDALAHVKTVVFDKTGTLTQGVFRVTRVVPSNGFTEKEILAAAAAVETYSNHPIAQSIREAYGEAIPAASVSDYREIPGHGVSALVNGKRVAAGNDRMLHQNEIPHETCNVSGTNVHVVTEDVYMGYLVIADEVKEDAGEAVTRLRNLGVKQIVMLTGDEENTARCVAESLGLDKYYAQLLPEGKVGIIEELQSGAAKSDKLAFVGDGINDAPVITRADVGIAMGGLGSDAAIEAADVVLMEDKPAKLATAIEISRFTRKIVRQNIYAALGVKFFFVILGTAGVASIWEAVFADVGITLLAVFNASRTLRFGKKRRTISKDQL
jgi:Zn2+/Cd2+-exporting ATPase